MNYISALMSAALLCASANQVEAYDKGTHHLCKGLYAHQETDGTWRLFRSHAGEIVDVATEHEGKSKADLMSEHCGPGEHPDVHS